MKNYLAKWILTGAPDDTSEEAKSFQRAMNANDYYYRDQLIDIRNIFQTESDKDIYDQIEGRIAYERGEENKSLLEKIKSKRDELYEEFVEELKPIEDLVKSFETETGKKLKDSENPMTALRLYRGAAGLAKIMIEGESEFVEKALRHEFPSLKFEKFGEFKTMFNILKDIDALDNEKIRRKFSVYLAACHIKDIHLKNHEIEKRQDKINEKIQNLQEKLSNTADPKEIKELSEKIKSAQQRLDKLEIYQTPLFRVFDENENVSFGDSLKRMTGSSRDLIDPLLSIGRNTYTTIKRAEKNRAKILLANLAREGGVGKIIEEVDNKNPNVGTTITFYEGGQKKYLDTDPSVVKAVNNLTPVQMSAFMRFLRIGTTLIRNLATVYNPSFALRNLVRDQQEVAHRQVFGVLTAIMQSRALKS